METIEFIKNTIDENARIALLSMKEKFSPALSGRYTFWQLDLLGASYLLASPNSNFTISRLRYDFAEIEAKSKNKVILYANTLNPYMKKRLISERIPFLLFDKQFYLPFLALNVTNEKTQVLPARSALTPAAQTIFLFLLYAEDETTTQLDIQKALGLSAITVSRAVGEIKALGLIEIKTSGKTNRKQELIVSDRKAFYEIGRTYFGKAVKQTIYCIGKLDEQLLLSGLAALSERSLLNPPSRRGYVLHSRKRISLRMEQISREEFLDSDSAVRIDLLTYDPSHLALDGMADPFTMIQTLEERDERVEKELAAYMKGFSWYTD